MVGEAYINLRDYSALATGISLHKLIYPKTGLAGGAVELILLWSIEQMFGQSKIDAQIIF